MRQQLPLEEVTLAEALRARGYATAAIGKWHLGGAGFSPLEQGFDVYHQGQANTTPSDTEGGKGEYDLTREATRFIGANRERPFFLYLAHNNPHIPYREARPELVSGNAGAFDPPYAATIQTLDDSLGVLLRELDAAGLREHTWVIFTSDNGGLHMPEGPHARVTHNTPFRAGKGYMYEGGLRVPLIVRGPGAPRGQVVDAALVNTDWMPTLLELAGAPPAAGLDGVSQARLLRTGRPAGGARSFFWHLPHYTNQGSRPAGAVRDGRWKLVEHYDDGRAELFDLEEDAAETRDLGSAQPHRVSDLRQRLAAWRQSVGAQENTPNAKVDETAYRRIYVEFDATRFDPLRADAAAWAAAATWRQRMNEAVKAPLNQTKAAERLAPGWSRMESGTTNSLHGIWGAFPGDVFAVGPKGTILHFDGRTWSPMAIDGAPHLLSIWGASGRDVFAVGDNGVIVHYDGHAWTQMHSGTTKNLIAVWGASGRDVFAVGYGGTVLHYDGRAWTPMASGTSEDLYGVFGTSPSHVVAVGGTPTPMPGRGLIVCYDGRTWTPMAAPAPPFLFGVWGTSAQEMHAVGIDLAALRWDGKTWQPAPIELPRVPGAINGLTRLWGSGADDVYAAGFNGVLARFDGRRWTPVPTGTDTQLGGVIAFSPHDVFVVGGGGLILRYSPAGR
jgi:arylsulfatase A-like enzyme